MVDSLFSAVFKLQSLVVKEALGAAQRFLSCVGLLLILGTACGASYYYYLQNTPWESKLLLEPTCEIGAFDWINLGYKLEYQYNAQTIRTHLDRCNTGYEFGWVVWTIFEARVLTWASTATGLVFNVNMGARNAFGNSVNFEHITCINRFTYGHPVDQVTFTPASNFLERRSVTFTQSSTGASCTVSADEFERLTVDLVKNSHTSRNFCDAIRAKVPTRCQRFNWAGTVSLIISVSTFIIAGVSLLAKKEYTVQPETDTSKNGNFSGSPI
uniref:Uncharacterized protein n=1 Tax=Neobodo designis TaxID=312471 RepID=A0A7S1Q8M1_NEODS|mmetsp:Transcript_34428/g.106355  ORF Transcript_34428/g.106355 Transcript_34428/m.106355 type:complete len:270 (+) Transcript_34428:46-855(+)